MHDTPENTYLKKELAEAKFSSIHLKIWLLCSFGILLDGLDLTMIGLALPLIIKEFSPSPLQEGFIAASAVLGMIFGAIFGGLISDKVGRKKVYLLDLIAFFILTLLTAFSPNITSLIILRFLLGIALGADYPASSSYISELVPSKIRGRMLGLAIMQFVIGSFIAALIALLTIKFFPHLASWRIMLGVCALPALIVGFFRLKMCESPYWLISKGKIEEAISIIAVFCKKSVDHLKKGYEEIKRLNSSNKDEPLTAAKLFTKENRHALILISLPWFILDLVAFAIGAFTPVILTIVIPSLKTKHPTSSYLSLYTSFEATAFLGAISILGYLLGIFLVEKIGRIKLQISGFIGMILGLSLLIISSYQDAPHSLHDKILLFGFSVYYFCVNMGPGAVTYILPNELFPTPIRAKAHGFATMSGKCGAFIGILFMPLLINELDLKNVLIIFTFVSLLGLYITKKYGRETKSIDLE